jgi:hypothetical protein
MVLPTLPALNLFLPMSPKGVKWTKAADTSIDLAILQVMLPVAQATTQPIPHRGTLLLTKDWW